MASTFRVARTLLRQGMPLTEIRAVLTAQDSLIVHRHLELHLERLEESVARKRSNLEVVAGLLTRDGSSSVCAMEGDVPHLTKVSVDRR